ncbi:MAG: periplasmic heavy metal sensor [Proteobacteria bacterium]|nr:periplasmic heavy metal sensor [Pseudomonadota bacterium]MBU1741685.1 periplasmic heavy metal sensor [Pseudomonadota bacterium]
MKRMVVLMVAAALVIGLALAGGPSQARGPMIGPGDCPSLAKVIWKLIQVDLTKDQKRAMARLLLTHRPELRATMGRLHLARKALAEALLAPRPDQRAVKAAYGQLAAAGERLALLAARVLPRLRAVLTPKQIKLLEGVHVDVKNRVQCRIVTHRAVVDRWLAVHAK